MVEKKDEDSCDVYQDKWTSKKSGRELYLADILRIANGGESVDETKKSSRKSEAESKRSEMNGSVGRVNKNVGLGPLDELFRDFQKGTKDSVNKAKKPKRLQTYHGKGISLQERKLPSSFWIEPKPCTQDVNKPTESNPPKNTPSEGNSSQGKIDSTSSVNS